MPNDIEWLIPAIEAATDQIRLSVGEGESTIALGSAFAEWAIQVVAEGVGRAEASEATAVGSQVGGDRGIDGWFVSEAGDELVVLQAKFSSAPLATRLDPGDVRELQSAYNRIVYSKASNLSPSERDIKAAAELVRENQGQIRVILVAWMTASAETQSRAGEYSALFAEDERLEVWDVYQLAEEWSKVATDEDLSKLDDFVFSTTTQWLEMPGPTPEGVLQAGVISIDAFSLADGLRAVAARAIAPNVRFHLGHRGPVNRHILQTLNSEPEKFWLLNNGLTIIADNIVVQDKTIQVKNPQIVNGGQTLFSLIGSLAGTEPLRPEFANVLARFVVLDTGPLPDGGEPLGSQLQREISESTNRQNKITAADLRSNDDVQQELAVAFSRTTPKWFYERKRNSRAALSLAERRDFYGIITKDELGQRWRAFDGDPAGAIKAKSKMYADDEPGTKLYKRTFDSSRDPYLYILAYLLFEDYRQRRVRLPRYADELARSQNLWAAHCTALTRVAFATIGAIDARRLCDLILRGELEPVYEAIEALGISWLRGRFQAAKRDEQNLQLKAVMEDAETVTEWQDSLKEENEGIFDAVNGILTTSGE